MANLVTIAALKASNLATLNNSVPDLSIDPSEHNQTMIDTIDTVTNGAILQLPLVSGTTIKTVNSNSLLGAGDVAITPNATHTGEVTGATALTVQPLAISNKTLLASLVGTEEFLVNDAGILKKILASSLSSGGKVAIYNTSGIPTFYSDFGTAYAAATTGQAVYLFANAILNVQTEIKSVDIYGNGFKITNNLADSSSIFQKTTGSTTEKWHNLTLERINSGASGGRCVVGVGGTVDHINYDVKFTNNGDGASVYLAGVLGSWDGGRFYNTGGGYGFYGNIPKLRNVYGYNPTYVGIRIYGGCIGEFLEGETISSYGLIVDPTAIAYDSIGRSVSGMPLGFVSSTGTHIRCRAISASGTVAGNGTYLDCFLESSSGIVAQTCEIEGGTLKSGSNYCASSSNVKNANLESGSSPVVLLSNTEKIFKNNIKTRLNTAAGHAIVGTVATVEIDNNVIETVHGSAYPINVTGNARVGLNRVSAVAPSVYSPSTTLVAGTLDAQANLIG